MKIGGLQKFSLIDYPDKICAIVFTQGCNFLCPYCHNPELVKPELFQDPIAEEDFFDFLKGRKGQIGGSDDYRWRTLFAERFTCLLAENKEDGLSHKTGYKR